MKKPSTPIIIGILLICFFSLIWWWVNKEEEALPVENLETKVAAKIDHPQAQAMPEALPSATFVNTTEKQREFNQHVQDLIKATAKCREDLSKLFPMEQLEGPSKVYKNVNQFKAALQKFYQVVSRKVDQSNRLVAYMETLPEGEIPPEQLFAQLSAIEDCGDFEEEAVLDQALTTALEMKWSIDQKRELASSILQLFKSQLQTPLGLHQISSKVEVLHSLVDDGFLSSRLSSELTTLDQAMEAAETEFRQSLPQEYTDIKYPTLQNILEIKKAENYITEKMKQPLFDIISSAEPTL